MSKQFKEVELDDVCGETRKVPPKKTISSSTTKKTENINLSIPYGNNKYKTINLYDCNGDDFVDWIEAVYPLDLELEPLLYRNISNRIAKYQHIIKFYSFNLFSLKNPIKELPSC